MPRRYYVLLTLITLAAAFLRLWQLTEVPPGLHYDLAATALLGNDVAFAGYRPIFISAYTGHEALYYYWLALWFRLAGSSIFTLRLAAATLGVLAIPATWFALRELLRLVDEEASYPIAALGSAFLATAFFHVTFSRFGFRVISEPVVQGLALGFLLRGVRLLRNDSPSSALSSFVFRLSLVAQHNAFINLAFGGALTALAAYTYLAARLFPVPLAIFWGALLVGAWRGGQLKRYALGFAAYSVAAVAVFAPLGVYFVRHPEDFLNRAGQVVPRAGEAGLLLEGVRRAAEMIFINGEPYDRFNIPGLPLFGAVLGIFFVIGLLLTLRDLLRPPAHSHTHIAQPPGGTATYLLLLAWVPLMLLPTALSVHDIFPSNVRAFGLIPLLFVFPARGLAATYQWVQKHLPGPLIPTAYPLAWLTLLALALGTGATARQYFRVWAELPNQRLNNDADLTAIAAYLNDTDLTGTSVYVSSIHYRHPTFAYLLDAFESVRWLTGGTSLAAPADGAALYAFARSAQPPEEWLAEWGLHLVAAPLDPDGVPAFRAYRFEAGQPPPLPVLTPLNENFANIATLTGYRAIPTSTAVLLDLQWRIENPAPAGDFLPHARLDDAWGQVWGQTPGFTYPSEQWSPGDTLLTRVMIPLPPGTPPGDYTLKVGMYSAGTDMLLSRLSAQNEYAGNRVALPPVTLAGWLDAPLETFLTENSVTPPEQDLSPDSPVRLSGYQLNATAPRQGEPLELRLYWQALRAPAGTALTLRLGETTLYTGQPVHGQFPFADWRPDQTLIDRFQVRIPPDFELGPAPLTVELDGIGTARLGSLDVQRVDRQFDAQPVDITLDTDFGGLVTLHGYTLIPGATTTLNLVWHSLMQTEQRFSVFVHVLDENGQLVAQADAEPQGGRYATPLWQPGEYIPDDYAFNLPPGTYTLRVGLYVPETGERLAVRGGSDYVEVSGVVVP